MKFYRVTLTDAEIKLLGEITGKGKRRASIIRNAYILLNADEGVNGKGQKDADIAELLGITTRTLENVRKKFVLDGFETALYGKKSERAYDRKIDGDAEAHLVALSCGAPPKGYARWSLRLLADRMVELEYADSISHETVRTVLKKTNLSRGGKRDG